MSNLEPPDTSGISPWTNFDAAEHHILVFDMQTSRLLVALRVTGKN